MKEREQGSTQETATIDLKRVVAAAAAYLKSLLGKIDGLRLEEIEEGKGSVGWRVTFSFVPQSNEDLPFMIKREYKQIETNAFGKPIAMRIRRIE